MKIKDVVSALERFAPLPLQESYDNAGLQIGLTETEEASGALLCLDVTEAVIDEAVNLGCNIIVAHHPLLFRPLSAVTDRTQVERCVRLAIQHNIAIYAAHTNLDNALDGVNHTIACKLGAQKIEPMLPHAVTVDAHGVMQQYVASSGVMAVLPQTVDALSFLKKVKHIFAIKCLMHNELLGRPIKRIAICGGSGEFMLKQAIAQEADAFLTGEMGYHAYFGHEQEIQIAVMGHYQSEQFTTEIFQTIIKESCPALPVFVTSINTNPINYL